MLSKLFSFDQIGFLDLNLLDGAQFMSVYTGRFTNLLIFCNSLTVERCLRISGGATFERTGSHCRLVPRTQPVMIRIVLFNWVSTFFVCTLLSQTGAQLISIPRHCIPRLGPICVVHLLGSPSLFRQVY